MILKWLAQDFAGLFAGDSQPRVALWCDARAEFQGLLAAIEPRLASKEGEIFWVPGTRSKLTC